MKDKSTGTPSIQKGTWGGKRPGAGRKHTPISSHEILKRIRQRTGAPFEDHFIDDWMASIGTKDRISYNALIFSKVVADRQIIEIDDTNTVAAKADAFMGALAMLRNSKGTVPSIPYAEGRILNIDSNTIEQEEGVVQTCPEPKEHPDT